MASGMIKPYAYEAIFEYGTTKLPRSNIRFPSVNIHNGSIANAAIVLVVVIAMDKSRLPPNITVHIFDAPPAGQTPVKNNPNCNSTLFGNKNKPNP